MKPVEVLQNLLLVGIADGEITQEEKKLVDYFAFTNSIAEEEYRECLENINELSFVIPAGKEEAIDQLRKMILLCIADDELNEDEDKALYRFAKAAGFTKKEYGNIVKNVIGQYHQGRAELVKQNQNVCDQIATAWRNTGKSDIEIAVALKDVIEKPDLQYVFSDDKQVNQLFYALLWLIFFRFCRLNTHGKVPAMMAIDRMASGIYTLDDLILMVKLSEEKAGSPLANPMAVPLVAVKQGLRSVFPFK